MKEENELFPLGKGMSCLTSQHMKDLANNPMAKTHIIVAGATFFSYETLKNKIKHLST